MFRFTLGNDSHLSLHDTQSGTRSSKSLYSLYCSKTIFCNLRSFSLKLSPLLPKMNLSDLSPTLQFLFTLLSFGLPLPTVTLHPTNPVQPFVGVLLIWVTLQENRTRFRSPYGNFTVLVRPVVGKGICTGYGSECWVEKGLDHNNVPKEPSGGTDQRYSSPLPEPVV